jgi:hypothetical protein
LTDDSPDTIEVVRKTDAISRASATGKIVSTILMAEGVLDMQRFMKSSGSGAFRGTRLFSARQRSLLRHAPAALFSGEGDVSCGGYRPLTNGTLQVTISAVS